MKESFGKVVNQDEVTKYHGEWQYAMNQPEVTQFLEELNQDDMDALDIAFNMEDINARYFIEFYEHADDAAKNTMNIALSELHIAPVGEKEVFAKKIATLLS